MDAFTNARLFTGDDHDDTGRRDVTVLVNNGVIVAVIPAVETPEYARRHDVAGGILTPGFIDLQVNGGGGVLLNDDPSLDALTRISTAHRRFGTTRLLPTLISDGRAQRLAARRAVSTALATGVPGGILGLHLEGPHLNPVRRGVHDARWLTPPQAEDRALMAPLDAGSTVVTLAPESVPLAEIAALAAAGVRVFAGHSAASYDLTQAALDAGVIGFTHLFNAMPPFASREPGIVGAALDDRSSWCGLIVDGHHLHNAAIRLALRAKPTGKVFLVTDAMPPVGATHGEHQDFRLGGEVITVQGGRCVTADGRLAGSALDMATAVRNCVNNVGVGLAESLRMASRYPAECLGLGHRLGRIAPGYTADFVILDERLTVRQTFLSGRS